MEEIKSIGSVRPRVPSGEYYFRMECTEFDLILIFRVNVTVRFDIDFKIRFFIRVMTEMECGSYFKIPMSCYDFMIKY